MLYQPSFPSPYLSTIDANKENTFRFKVNGDCVVAYQILIYNASTNELVYEGNKEDCCVYGNDGDDSFIEATIPAYKTDENGDFITDENGNKITILTNGLDYVWKAKLWQNTHDIEVVRGRVYEGVTSGSEIKIRPHIEDSVKKDMILRVGTQHYTVNSCVLQYPKFYSINDCANGIYLNASDVTNNFYVGNYVTVGCFRNSYNKSTKVCQIKSISGGLITFSDTSVTFTTKGVSYIQNVDPSLYSTVKLKEYIPNTITAGTEYVVLSDFVECDVGFYFKARTEPDIVLFNNNTQITNGIIESNISSINITAQYTQEQGANIKRWRIDLKDKERIIDTTGDVYNGKIQYIYNALLPQEYKLCLTVESNDGCLLEDSITINVEYNNANALLKPKIKTVHDSAIRIDWSDSLSIIGKSNTDVNDIEYDGESISLKSNQSILWDNVDDYSNLSIDDPTSIKTLVTNLSDYNGTILEVFDSNGIDKIELGYDSTVFWWTVNGIRFEYNPYSESIYDVGVEDNSPSDILYLWNDSDEAIWDDSESSIWHYNDVGEMYWWLIQINLYETDHSKMVAFTKYRKE